MQFTISLNKRLIETLRDYSKKTDKPMSKVISRLLDEYLGEEANV